MKKIWLMWLMVCAVCTFSACSDDDDPIPQNPVTEVKMPATAEIGTEINVSGKGFTNGAQLYLKDTEGEETKVDGVEFSASGAIFKVPMSLQAGEYTLVLLQSGRWELGKITLTPASLPVVGLDVPAEGLIGKKLTIAGSGFNATAKVFLEDAAGTRTELSEPDVTNGFVAKIPATVSAGTYKLVLALNGGEWTLEDEFSVVVAPVIKRIAGIRYISSVEVTDWSPLETLPEEYFDMFGVSSAAELREMLEPLFASMSGETGLELVYENGLLKESRRDGEVAFTFSGTEYEISGENQAYDGYNTLRFTLNLEDGKVGSSSMQYKPDDEAKSFDWQYDDNNHYQGTIGGAGRYYTQYGFVDGNLVSDEKNGIDLFEYGQPEWKNNSYGVDVAMCLYLLGDPEAEEAELYAALLRLNGTPSVNLPSSALLTGSPMPLVYEYDKDGYVVSTEMSGESMDEMLGLLPTKLSDRYEFVYEVVDYE